jgi:hypothetical protein
VNRVSTVQTLGTKAAAGPETLIPATWTEALRQYGHVSNWP